MGLSNHIVEVLVAKAREKRMPVTVNFELLPVCNLDCKMCYIRTDWKTVEASGGLRSADEWIKLAKELHDAGTLFLLLTGGEVFLYPDFQRLYIELYKMGFVITINTNATLINETVIEWLSKYPPKCVSVSLYGSNNEIYEKQCGKKGMFTKVDCALTLLQKANIAVECKTILTPQNKMDLENCWKYVQEKNIPYEAATYSFPATRRCDKEKQIRFTPEEVVECTFMRNRIMSTEEEYTEEIRKYLKKYNDTKNIEGKDHFGFTCSASNTSCWITWQGVMTPCAMLPTPATKPFEQGFLSAWKELKQQTDVIMLSSQCSHCDKRQICTVCPASAYGETGNIGGTSEYHCQMTKLLLKEMKEYMTNIGEQDEKN